MTQDSGTPACECYCHVNAGASCTIDAGGSGVAGVAYCGPHTSSGADGGCDLCGARGDERHGWVEGDCILPHHTHSRRLVPGAHVCRGCTDRWGSWLTEVVEMYATLGDVVLAGSVPDTTADHGRPKKAPAAPIPLRLEAWALLYGTLNSHVRVDGTTVLEHAGMTGLPNIADILGNWAQAAFDAQSWTAEAPRTVAGAAAVLRSNPDVMAHLPDVDTYDAELRWVRRSLLAAHGKSDHSRRPVGRCPSLDGDGRKCDGPLWPDTTGRMAVDCGRCNRHFDEPLLRHLGGMLKADTPTG